MNTWKMLHGQYVKVWDHEDLVAFQEVNGPPTRIIAALLDRIEAHGPQIATVEEELEIERLQFLKEK